MRRPGTPLPVLLAGLTLSGCSLAPAYERPALPVAQVWPVATPEASSAVSWRALFHDQRLQQVVTLSLQNSRDLRIAAANVERARALWGQARAPLMPSVNATLSNPQSGSEASGSLGFVGIHRWIEM